MAKNKRKNRRVSQVWKLYDVSGDKIKRKNPFSLKGGTGVFLAVHKNRKHCGKTGYTEYNKKTENIPSETNSKTE